jgi:hypothetical protein
MQSATVSGGPVQYRYRTKAKRHPQVDKAGAEIFRAASAIPGIWSLADHVNTWSTDISWRHSEAWEGARQGAQARIV